MECTASQETTRNDALRDTPLPAVHTTTHGLPADERFATWRQTADALFNTSAAGEGAFDASLQVFHFNRFLLCSGHLDGARYRRDHLRLRCCDLDHYLLHVPLQRGLVAGNGLRVRPGDVAVLDLTQPADLRTAAGEGISLLVPRTALLAFEANQLHGLVLRRGSANGRLLAGVLKALAVAAPGLGQDDGVRLSLPILAVVAACLAKEAGSRPATAQPGPTTLGRRARLYIEHNLHRDDLSPAVLAKALATSRSQLYRAFERFGGVRHYVLQRRLRRCLLAFGEAGNGDRRIGDVAYANGFADEAHFSRVFRKAFGLSPTSARTALQRGELPTHARLMAPIGEGPVLAQWISELACH
ncbi:helix-turn-helix domain-containing protein [Pseudomonas sp. EMN2]|uniref:helix-turn-helix domain-containing protein n=1 Tax=Pseudomonas sp. EMN2 TaxID=2615212 RepID=UPI00129BFEF2|nr:helix-turn-helix domain-containing protein [Pseudomonas sp. EMN2]